MPRMLSVGSVPLRAFWIQLGNCLATASISSSVASDIVLELPGELATAMPSSVAAATSTFSMPTPGVTTPRNPSVSSSVLRPT